MVGKRTLGALCCALLLAACSRAGSDAGRGALHEWTHPGELRVAIQHEPNTLNPLLSANTTEAFINRLSFDLLVTVAADGKTLVPELASEVPTTANGGISRDGLTITYKLRSGVKWQDGVPFTSKDVKFSWQAMMNDANNVNTRTGYEDIASVDTPNDTTVVFHLKHPFAPFVTTVFSESDDSICVVPAHMLAKYPDVNRVPFNENPVGTGPFKVAEWVRGDHITLVANPDYFLGAPKLKRIVIRQIPDENTEINSLRTHEIDWMFEPSPVLYTQLKAMSDITIHLGSSPQTLKLQMNNARAQLKDIRVRRAIAYAVDKALLVHDYTGGSAQIAGADQPPFSWAYEPNIPTYPPSVAKAKGLLAQAGYRPGPGGVMQKNGTALSLQLSTNSENATRRLVETQIQSMLQAIGIDVQIKNYPGNLFFATYGQGGVLTGGKYDLAVDGWVAGIDPDDHSLFACDQIPPAGVDYTRYCSPEMDAAQRAALGTYDQAKRTLAYHDIQRLLGRDVPEIYIWYPRFPQATNPDFKGFDPNPVNEAWNAYQWEM